MIRAIIVHPSTDADPDTWHGIVDALSQHPDVARIELFDTSRRVPGQRSAAGLKTRVGELADKAAKLPPPKPPRRTAWRRDIDE